jgi:DNA repair exonuclease SbcCD nuclease subunit
MFQFLHAADLHLDSPLRGLERYDGAPVEQVRQAARRALENLVQLAIESRVAFVLIAGDLYDGDWRDFHTGLFFVAQMARLREAGIRVLLIAGNHDAANRMTRSLRLPENVRLLSPDAPETVRLDEFDVAVHGQSFAAAAVSENLALRYPAAVRGMFNIGLLHTAATGGEGHEPYAPCTPDDLRAKGYDYWALGHIHKQQSLGDDPPIWFSGNTQGRHIRETGPKGCLLVTVEGRGVRVEPRPLDVLRWELCRVDAGGAATGSQLLDEVRHALGQLTLAADAPPRAVRVTIAGRTPLCARLVAQAARWTNEVRAAAIDLGGDDLWIEKVVLATSPPAAPSAARDDGPIAELLARIALVQRDPQALAALGGELAELCQKLPPELREGPDALVLDSPDGLRPLLDEVRALLIEGLAAPEAAP